MQLIICLILIQFLQTVFLGFDLMLVVIASRSLIVEEKSNYYLAFSIGLLGSHLTGQPLGFLSLIYLLTVKVTHLLKRTSLGNHYLTVLPLIFFFSLIVQFTLDFFSRSSFNFSPVIWQTVFALPVYLIIKFWEERFILKKEIKLKIGR